MLDGVMLLWFILAAAALLFVAIDVRSTPESTVMKWGFVPLTAYTGVIGAFLYVLGCREPLPGTHEQFVAARWRQVLGSTMHCVAGDGVGILAGAVISSTFALHGPAEVILEYGLGFGFGRLGGVAVLSHRGAFLLALQLFVFSRFFLSVALRALEAVIRSERHRRTPS